FIQAQLRLSASARALLRLRNRRDQRDFAARLDDLLGRLALLIELPVPAGVLVGRVQDGTVEEGVGHCSGVSGLPFLPVTDAWTGEACQKQPAAASRHSAVP